MGYSIRSPCSVELQAPEEHVLPSASHGSDAIDEHVHGFQPNVKYELPSDDEHSSHALDGSNHGIQPEPDDGRSVGLIPQHAQVGSRADFGFEPVGTEQLLERASPGSSGCEPRLESHHRESRQRADTSQGGTRDSAS